MIAYADNGFIKTYKNALNKTREPRKGPYAAIGSLADIVRVYLLFVYLCAFRGKAIKKVRDTIELAEIAGKDAAPYHARGLETSKIIRDSFVSMADEFAGSRAFKPLAFFAKNAAIDWDDLVVDLAVSNDPEIKESLSLLADAV